jgi:DNA-binding NarL/FixJ family response regulator
MQTLARPTAISVYLVDDQAILRAAFSSLVRADDRFVVVGDSGDAREALAEIEQLRPDVVLLDITMPGLSGLDIIEPLRRSRPRTKILVLSGHEAESFVEQALRLGADGYLSKDSEPAEITLAIQAVHRGDSYLSPRVARPLTHSWVAPQEPACRTRIASLTPREREVFQLLALGKANKQVARELGISLGTAKKHRENLQRKLDCHSAAELARLAIREGLMTE